MLLPFQATLLLCINLGIVLTGPILVDIKNENNSTTAADSSSLEGTNKDNNNTDNVTYEEIQISKRDIISQKEIENEQETKALILALDTNSKREANATNSLKNESTSQSSQNSTNDVKSNKNNTLFRNESKSFNDTIQQDATNTTSNKGLFKIFNTPLN